MKKTIFILVTLCMLFIIIDILYGAFDPLGISYVRESETFMNNILRDATCDYVLPQNIKYKFNVFSVRLNNYGLRGPNIYRKTTLNKRILFLGDSVVFGWGVEEDSSFVGRFREYYQKSDTAVEVICAAVPSWNTYSEFNYLKTNINNYKPDIIILMIVANDMIAHEDQVKSKNYLSKLKSYVIFNSNILLTLRYLTFRYNGSTREDKSADDITVKNNVRENILGIIRLCENNKIPLIFVLNGSEEFVRKNKSLCFYSNLLKEVSKEYLVLPNILMDNKFHTSYCDSHFNSEANKIIYDELMPIIKSRFK